MRTRHLAWFSALALGVWPVASSTAAPQAADLRGAEMAIMQADREFNRAVADGNRERFAALITDSAVFNGGTPDEAQGKDAILKSWSPFFEASGPRLTWEPSSAHVLIGGDVGVTIGSWVRTTKGGDGRVVERRGQYVTTWLKQPDGRWLVSADIGSTGN